MDFQQSQTFINLQSAYEFNLISAAKYQLFAKRAREEVLIEIALVYETISRNKQYIAEELRRRLFDGTPDTIVNLFESRDEELAGSELYRDYSRIATEEGYRDVASLLNGIANINLNHNYTFQSIITDMQSNQLFCREEESLWICLACGNIMGGLCAPDICPICQYPQGYYEFLRYV